MFDISFSEMVVIAVITLIVVGPERLPKVARTLGHLWGRAQRYINGVKADISRDMALEELRQLQTKVQQEADALGKETRAIEQQINQQVQQPNRDAAQIAAVPQPSSKPALSEQQKFPID